MRAGSRPSGPNANGAQTASRAKKAKFQKTAQRPMPRSSSWRTTKRAPAWMEATKEGRCAALVGAGAFGKARKQAKARAAPKAARAYPQGGDSSRASRPATEGRAQLTVARGRAKPG